MTDDRGWLGATFDAAQRRHLEEVFEPFGNPTLGVESLLVGTDVQVAYNLGTLLSWFDNPRDRAEYGVPILHHLIDCVKAIAVDSCADVEGLHFAYQSIMTVAYKLRDDPTWLDVALWAATSQVELAPRTALSMHSSYPGSPLPQHRGYERLTIHADKRGDDEEVIRLSEAAAAQGWAGDWDRRVTKARRRSKLPGGQ